MIQENYKVLQPSEISNVGMTAQRERHVGREGGRGDEGVKEQNSLSTACHSWCTRKTSSSAHRRYESAPDYSLLYAVGICCTLGSC